MNDILVTSISDQDRTRSLLEKNVPSYRQAYSDRTAWLMACLSELAYIRFNPLFKDYEPQQWCVDLFGKLIDDGKKSSLMKLIDKYEYDSEKEKILLEKELDSVGLKLVATFDNLGTQAILVSNDNFLVLAFRGTEATSIRDIKADAKAKKTQCETGGKIHTGFKEGFENVAMDIQRKLSADEARKKPLFVTGHSLGGALATVAAKKIKHEGGIAACYTFGSPRVGDEEWMADIKTPIYRLVNATDCVTMLPPGDESICLTALALKGVSMLRIPLLSRPMASFSRWLVSNFGGYRHGGNMRYMTNCKSGRYDDVQLLYSVGWFRRIKGWIAKKAVFKKFLADHSIKVYRKKLMVIAEKRN